jgi:hypothetical protein
VVEFYHLTAKVLKSNAIGFDRGATATHRRYQVVADDGGQDFAFWFISCHPPPSLVSDRTAGRVLTFSSARIRFLTNWLYVQQIYDR